MPGTSVPALGQHSPQPHCNVLRIPPLISNLQHYASTAVSPARPVTYLVADRNYLEKSISFIYFEMAGIGRVRLYI